MKQTPNRGGRRKGAGRKPLGKAKYTVTLTKANAEHAKKVKSNFSGLLDRLLEDWIEKNP